VQILTQILQIRGALFRSIFGGNECPYLIFRVRRDNLIRDTLLQVRHVRAKTDEQKKNRTTKHTQKSTKNHQQKQHFIVALRPCKV
jgi:hypothetical protein